MPRAPDSANRLLDRLSSVPRFALARWPTPIERVDGGPVPGGSVLVKRDDLCGFGRGGVKVRKIEHVLGHLRSRGYDELITVAGNVVNLAHDLLPALDRCGIRGTLLCVDDPPCPDRLRRALFEEIGHRVRLLDARGAGVARVALAAWLRGRREGRRPFLLLPSMAHPAAVVGNACGFLEMAAQLEARGSPLPRAVFVAVASGTMLAGFVLGEAALRAAGRPPVRIVGVQAYPGPARRWTLGMLRWTERWLRLGRVVPVGRIEILASRLGEGFAGFPPQVVATCRRVRAATGLAIDPIFAGRAWSAMEARLRVERGPSAAGRGRRPVLFWLCGYTPEWRALAASTRSTTSGEALERQESGPGAPAAGASDRRAAVRRF